MAATIKHYIDAAYKKGWRVEWVDESYGIAALYPPNEEPIIIRNNVTELGSAIGCTVARYKAVATKLAAQAGFTVPKTVVLESGGVDDEARCLLDKFGSVAVKPMDGGYGNGVTLNVTTEQQLQDAITTARAYNVRSTAVVVQQFCPGRDYRLLFLDGEVIAAIERIAGEAGIANLSKGGKAIDVTADVHPDVVGLVQKLAGLIKLDMCGVDLLSNDISLSVHQARTYFIEINCAPGIGGHYHPGEGKRRDVATMILDAILRKRRS